MTGFPRRMKGTDGLFTLPVSLIATTSWTLHDVFCLLMLCFIACRFLYALLAVTVGAFAGAIALIAVSFYWFNPSGAGDCSFNIFVMAVTILLTLAVSLGSLHPQVGWITVGGLLQ